MLNGFSQGVCNLCRVFKGGQHVVFESSQTMNDIPFGDHFTVESRWDFSARPPRADGAAQTQVLLSNDLLSCIHTAPYAALNPVNDRCTEVSSKLSTLWHECWWLHWDLKVC